MSGRPFVDSPAEQVGWAERPAAPPLADIAGPVEDDTLVKVNLACGQRCGPGSIGVDIADIDGVDIVHDLKVYPWPFEDGTVDEVTCEHYVEHLDGAEFIDFMNELWRILADGGRATIETPYLTSYRAWADPTHKSMMHEAKFVYFNREWRENEKLDHGDYVKITANFDFDFGYRITDPRWVNAHEEAKARAIQHYWNVVDDLVIHLRKLP